MLLEEISWYKALWLKGGGRKTKFVANSYYRNNNIGSLSNGGSSWDCQEW